MPSWPGGRLQRTRRLGVPILLWIASLTLAACGTGLDRLGDESGQPPQALEVRFENNTESEVYLIVGFANDTTEEVLESSHLGVISEGEGRSVSAGPDRDDDTAPPCFVNEQYWIVRSLSGATYWGSPSEQTTRYADDLEVWC